MQTDRPHDRHVDETRAILAEHVGGGHDVRRIGGGQVGQDRPLLQRRRDPGDDVAKSVAGDG
ncbi:hypothetical protein ACVWWG_005302 [Bradyrhizobium sp. LB7.2]